MVGVVRRIPIETRGVSKRSGREWTRGGLFLEVKEKDCSASVPLFLTVWGDEMVERVNSIGVGKKVLVGFEIESSDAFDRFSTNISLREIRLLTGKEAEEYGF